MVQIASRFFHNILSRRGLLCSQLGDGIGWIQDNHRTRPRKNQN